MKIKDIGNVVTGKTPQTAHAEFYGGDYMFITPTELHGGYKISSSEKTLTEAGLESIKTNSIDGISVLVGCIGWDMGNVAMCFEKCATNQQINSITQISEDYSPYFLYYWLSTKKEYLFSISSVTRTPILSKGVFEEIEIPSISRSEQDKIAKVLLVLDKKIKLNSEVNDNLAKTIKAVFKSWFLDFDAFDGVELVQSQYGLIPNGWHYELLGNLCDCVTKGTTPTTLGKDFTDTGINFIKGESINDDHSFNKTLFAHIDDKTDELLKRSRIYVNDIVFTIAGTLGKFALVDSSVVPANTNQAVAIIRTSKIMPAMLYSYFIGEWQVEFYKRNTQQAVQANLSLGTIKDLPILLPDSKGQDHYMQLVTPLIVGMQNNFSEIERLYELQNQLLARLSSSR